MLKAGHTRRVKCQTPSKTQTDGRTDVDPFVRLSLCPLCLSGACILWGERTAMGR